MIDITETTLSRAEIEARVRILKWRAAQARVHEARLQLEQAADSHFRGCSAEKLIEQFGDAYKGTEGVNLTSPITKADEPFVQQVLAAHELEAWHRRMSGFDDGAARTAQQDFERARIELETRQAAQVHATRTAGIGPAPTAAPHPPFSAIPRDVVADWDKDEDGPSPSQKPKPEKK